jgi:hypothetical protein
LKLLYDDPLSNFAFNFNLRRYPSDPKADPTAAAAAAVPAATTTGTHDGNRAKAGLAVEVTDIISLSDITR